MSTTSIELQEFKSKNVFEVIMDTSVHGLGMKIVGGVPEREGIYVSQVLEGGAAHFAGLAVGDRLKLVDGIDFERILHDDAVATLQKVSGRKVVFVVWRYHELETSTDPGEIRLTTAEPLVVTENVQGGYGCKLSHLVKLISERGNNGIGRLNDSFGGVEGLCAKLKSHPSHGIAGDAADLEDRYRVFGYNRIPSGKSKTIWELMWQAGEDFLLRVLIVCGIISAILGATVDEDKSTAWIEGVAILIAVFIVIIVTAVNDLQREKQFQALQAKQDNAKLVNVIRNGKVIECPVFDLAVGDIYVIQTGNIVPADGILISSSDLATDESALTGESDLIKKSIQKNPFLLSGTAVKVGTGTMVITCVGLFSEEGTINRLITGNGAEEVARLEAVNKDSEGDIGGKQLTEEEKERIEKDQEKKNRKKESVLQGKLNRMAIMIGYIGTVAAIVTFAVLLLRYCVDDVRRNGYHAKEFWTEFLRFVILGITVLVVAVPEGLPLAVTIALAFSVKRMMIDNNLVRVLAACETMGNATTICSDKTGTLTKNRMTVVRAFANGRHFDQPSEAKNILQHDAVDMIGQGIAYNSSKDSRYMFQQNDPLPVQLGNKTECAILQFADNICEKNFEQYRQNLPASQYTKEFPFSSAKKRMSTVIPLANGFRLYTKGASEILLDLAAYELIDGQHVPLTPERKEHIKKDVIERYAEQALRVILLGYRDFPSSHSNWEDEEEVAKDITISCLVGIQDPVRDEVPHAVQICREAGVVVRMVTGDNLVTARSIAINCGILNPTENFTVMEGPDFRQKILHENGKINYKEFNQLWKNLRVIARCSPTDKYNLVKGLIKNRQVVAVTGDGTNDGPALSEADVGFAMGIAGTGVAKEASDIIVLDDNFNSIVKAVSWGRNVYDSIAKFLTFQLTVNIVAILVSIIGSAVDTETPLRAIQLLWVNLIMDTMASLALATEPPTPELLKRQPYGRDQPLISRIMFRQIIGHSIWQLFVLLFITFYGDKLFDVPYHDFKNPPSVHHTLVFNIFVWLQVFNEINARKIHGELNVFKGFFSNRIFLGVLIVTALFQVLIVEFGDKAFMVKSLTWDQWLICVGIGATELPMNVIIYFLMPETIFPERWFLAKEFEGAKDDDVVDDEDEEEDDEGTADKPVSPEKGEVKQLSTDSATPRSLRVHSTGNRPQRDLEVTNDPLKATRLTVGSRLWRRTAHRMRTHMRVIQAFRSAGALQAMRRRTSMLTSFALERDPNSDPTQFVPSQRPVSTNSSTLWKDAIRSVRHQVRVVHAFRNGLIKQRATNDSNPSSSQISDK